MIQTILLLESIQVETVIYALQIVILRRQVSGAWSVPKRSKTRSSLLQI